MSGLPSEKIRYKTQIFVCTGKACSKNSDPEAAKKFFKSHIKEADLKAEVRAGTCSCLDYCDDGPNIVIYPEGTLYKGVKESDWPEILEKHVKKS
jgi:(2Fe-2S) ferredoxin